MPLRSIASRFDVESRSVTSRTYHGNPRKHGAGPLWPRNRDEDIARHLRAGDYGDRFVPGGYPPHGKDRAVREILIGLDVGTTGVKGVAVTAGGELIASAEEGYALSTPHPGWVEQDPEDWWRAARAVLGRLPDGPIGLAGQMHGLVVLGSDGAVLRPAILRSDVRTETECWEIESLVGLQRLVELPGNRALPGFTAPKPLWLRRHETETWSRIRHVLLPNDYVRYRLTGGRAIDAADASGTLLFDVAHRRWSAEVCEALGIPLEWLPAAFESTEVAGAGDQAAAALGVGIDRPGLVSVVLGTSGVVFAALPAYLFDPQARAHV